MILLQELLENEEAIEDHLRRRGIDPSKTYVVIDKENGIATFMLYNLSGQLVGYQRYNPKGDKKDHTNSLMAKYYTYVTKEDSKTAKIAVWGLESFSPDDSFFFMTEGIFDAVKLHNAGYPAIALLSNNPKVLKSWLSALPQKKIVVADNDEAGSKLEKFGDLVIHVPTEYKDVGDMPQEMVNSFFGNVEADIKQRFGIISKKSHNAQSLTNKRIQNPQTGNDILIKTALSYSQDHPAHQKAVKMLRQQENVV